MYSIVVKVDKCADCGSDSRRVFFFCIFKALPTLFFLLKRCQKFLYKVDVLIRFVRVVFFLGGFGSSSFLPLYNEMKTSLFSGALL